MIVTPPQTFIPATPGWQVVYANDKGTAIFVDIAMWCQTGNAMPEPVVANVSGLALAREAFGGFLGIKTPSCSPNNWTQLGASLPAPVRMPAEPPQDPQVRFEGTVSGADEGVIQILPDGGGPVQELKTRQTKLDGTKAEQGDRVKVCHGAPGNVLKPAE